MNFHISSYIPNPKHITNDPDYSNIKNLRQISLYYIKNSKYYKKEMLSNEDLISNVGVSIWYSDCTYNEELEMTFESRRIQYVNWEIYRFLENKKKSYKFKDISHLKNIGSTKEIDQIDNKDEIKYILTNKSITDTEKYVALAKTEGNQTFTEIAAKLQGTKQHAHQIYKKFIQKARTTIKRSKHSGK